MLLLSLLFGCFIYFFDLFFTLFSPLDSPAMCKMCYINKIDLGLLFCNRREIWTEIYMHKKINGMWVTSSGYTKYHRNLNLCHINFKFVTQIDFIKKNPLL